MFDEFKIEKFIENKLSKLTLCEYAPDLKTFMDKVLNVPDQPTTVPTTISKEKQMMDGLAQFSKTRSLHVFTFF